MNLTEFSIIGNSVGGWVAAKYAPEFPDQMASIILVAPGGFTPHNWISRIFCRLQASGFSLPPYLWARLYLRSESVVTRAMLARARTIQAPVLLIFGEKDPAISWKRDGREAAMAIPHAEFVALPCGHAPFAEMPDVFLEKVFQFLRH